MLDLNKRGTREPQNKRQVMRELLPVKAPFVVNLNPTGICNFKCFFCPTNSENLKPEYRKYLDGLKLMSMEVFHKAVEGFLELEEQIKVIYLVGTGEPLLHPNIAEMVKTLKEKKVCREVRIITNGSLLNPELNQKLIDAGLDVLKISIEALDEEGYKSISGVDFNYEKFLINIEDYYRRSRGTNCVITAKILTDALKNEEQYHKFYDMFEHISDYQELRNIEPIWPGYDFSQTNCNHESIDLSEIGYTGICPAAFVELMINPDGSVSLCRKDWAGNLLMGNVKTDSIREIWYSDKRREYLKQHLNAQRVHMGFCELCERSYFGDVITDEDAKIIKMRMKL